MAIIAKETGEGSFTPAPEGAHPAVCVDVVDLGLLEVTYGGETKKQHKVRIVWQIDEAMDNGKPFIAQKRYTLSLHEKAALRKDLESWRGRPFTGQELQGFDLEVLVGVSCYLNIVHDSRNGKTYANIVAIMKLPKGVSGPKPRDYIRVKDRKDGDQNDAAEPEGPDNTFGGITDDDIPF